MRPVPWLLAEPYRINDQSFDTRFGDPFGAFMIPCRGIILACIVSSTNYKADGMSDDYAWEHVSVSCRNRTPNWYEMDFIKDVFWREDETVMQLHVPKSEHRNIHPHVLHLWRSMFLPIPTPPGDMV
jgi:hypothetical protein